MIKEIEELWFLKMEHDALLKMKYHAFNLPFSKTPVLN